MRVRGTWLVGDSPEADIAGAKAIGIPSVWLHRGRCGPSCAPTLTADSAVTALAAVFNKVH